MSNLTITLRLDERAKIGLATIKPVEIEEGRVRIRVSAPEFITILRERAKSLKRRPRKTGSPPRITPTVLYA